MQMLFAFFSFYMTMVRSNYFIKFQGLIPDRSQLTENFKIKASQKNWSSTYSLGKARSERHYPLLGDYVLALFAIRLQRILSKIEEANTTAFIISYEGVSMPTVPRRY